MIPIGLVKAKARRFWLPLLVLAAAAFETSAVESEPAVPAQAPGGAVTPANDPPEESSALTLPDALSRALRHSPALAAYAWDIRAADALVQQAGLRPNPALSLAAEEVRWTAGPSEKTRSTTLAGAVGPGGLGVPSVAWDREKAEGSHSGFAESEFTISIAQPIELGRKRAKRVALAEQQKALVHWDYETARADVLAQTATHFVEVLAAQERVALDTNLAELAEKIVRTFSLRVEAGAVSPLELSRAEVALATIQIAREENLKRLETACGLLASNWGDKKATFPRAVGRFDEIPPVPPLDEIEARIQGNPALARWPAELAARRADFTLECAQRMPDVTVELGFRSTGVGDRKAINYGVGTVGDFGLTRSETGYSADRDNSLVLGFSVPLPLFDRNQGRIAAAEARMLKVSDQRRAAETTAYAELMSAHQTASSAYTKATAIRDEILPKIDETFRKIELGYQQGKFSYLEVLDTQRTLFEAREGFLDALTQYHQGIVRIERVTGAALEQSSADSTDVETNNEE
jgi:cobalt-zinc-cadmium efflux system outer membrane protein